MECWWFEGKFGIGTGYKHVTVKCTLQPNGREVKALLNSTPGPCEAVSQKIAKNPVDMYHTSVYK